MSFDVNQFRQQLVGDGARANLFEVSMNFPAYSVVGDPSRKITFMCKTAQLPGSTVGTVQIPYFGREVKVAGNRTYPDWTVQIINDEDFVIRNSLEAWINGINDPVVNLRSASARVVDGGYGTDATVTQFAKSGAQIKQYSFVGMFPVDIAPIDVDWGANDSIEEFSVTFAYQYWTANSPTSSSVLSTLSSITI